MVVGLVRPTRGVRLCARRSTASISPHLPCNRRARGHRLPRAGKFDLPQALRRRQYPIDLGDARHFPPRSKNDVFPRCSRSSGWKNSSTRAATGCRAANVGASRSLARIATEPRFLLLDEPFTGIDPIAVADIQVMIRQLRDRGLGVLITDHQVRETLAIVDRAYILNGARSSSRGTARGSHGIARRASVLLGRDSGL